MTNTQLLLDYIDNSGLKRNYIARMLGITTYSLAQKIHNIREFKASEIYTLCKVLGISSPDSINAIFFAYCDDCNSSYDK